ncbi:MAG: oligosaccharide flippase family protein [Hyphomicrobiales bacterium]
MLLRQTLLYLPAQLLGPLAQFVAVIAWTHFLSPTGYGNFTLVTATQDFAYLVGMGWFTFYALRYYGDVTDPDEQARFRNTETVALAAGSVVQAVVGIGLLVFVVDIPLTPFVIAAVVIYMVTRMINTHFAERSRAVQAIGAYSVLQTVGPVAGLLLGLAATTMFQASAAVALAGYAVAQVAAIGLVAPLIGIGLKPQRMERGLVVRAMGYGLPLLVSGLFDWVGLNGIRFIVEWQMGAEGVGLLGVGWGLGQRGAAVAAMLVTAAAFPLALAHARKGGHKDGLAQLSRNGALLVAMLAPAVAGLHAISIPLVTLLVDPAFHDATMTILPLAVVAGALRNLRLHFADQTFLISERPGLVAFVDGAEAVVAVVSAWIGLQYGGLIGAAMGAAIGTALSATISFLIATLKFGLVIPWGAFVRIGIATLLMWLALHAVPEPQTILGLIGEVLLGAVIYGLALAAFYPRIVADFLRDRLARRAIAGE